MSESSPDTSRTGAGPIVLLLPLVGLVAGVFWAKRGQSDADGPPPNAPEVTAQEKIDGWSGSMAFGEGHLEARLVPLHRVEQRQGFDAGVLAERFRRQGGAPWQLVLTHTGPAEAEALPLAALLVTGSNDARLEPLVAEEESEGLQDPLRVLLSVPANLAVGHQVAIVLWGERPSKDLTLHVAGEAMTLTGSALNTDSLPRTLASLDRRDD